MAHGIPCCRPEDPTDCGSVSVPECLLSDRGASHLMHDVCEAMGIKKPNTTAYHPQCDGMVERFNRTLKAMLRKQAARYGKEWERYRIHLTRLHMRNLHFFSLEQTYARLLKLSSCP